MIRRTLALLVLACAVGMGRPGDLDRDFQPELRAWVAPDSVELAADGRAWIGGGFDRVNGFPRGDLLKLGANGGVVGEAATGYLAKKNGGMIFGAAVTRVAPFLLADGGFLLPGGSGGWLRMSAAGRASGMAFPDRMAGEMIEPQFERDGKLWVIRTALDGRRILERRGEDGRVDVGFALAATDLLDAVAGPDGGAWVLAGQGNTWFPWGETGVRRVFRVDRTGVAMGDVRVISQLRTLQLVAGPGEAFRLIYGTDQSRWWYWPAPTSGNFKVEWYSAAGVLERDREFPHPLYQAFVWAEAADGSWVATDAKVPVAGSLQYRVGKVAALKRYGPDGVVDASFISPGAVRSVKALAAGKWLVDGLRRLNANGSEDASWVVPELTRSAEVRALLPLPGGRVLTGGNFATADEWVRNRLVVFRADGQVDPTFVADERIGEWRSLAVVDAAIYVVTTEPVSYGNGVRSNLVKLRADGSLDEGYEPQVPGNSFDTGVRFQTVDHVKQVTALADGGLLVESSMAGGDVIREQVVRLEADGSQEIVFDYSLSGRRIGRVIALTKGGFVGDGIIYRRDGSVEQDLTNDAGVLQPLCQWRGGVVFLETTNGGPGWASGTGRFRWWRGGRWMTSFRAPTIANTRGVVAVPSEAGGLWVSAMWVWGEPSLRCLLPTGRGDRNFREPRCGLRERQVSGNWWQAEENGKVSYDPAAGEIATAPTAILWHTATRRLWLGGNFNVVNGKPRDGLAQVKGGNGRRF